MIVLGLLSGTSADGIDAAAAGLRVDGDTLILEPLGAHTTPLPAPAREALDAILPPRSSDVRAVCMADTLLGQAFADAAVRADEALCGGRADLVTSHGQTVYHWVDEGACRGTLQLGQPAWIAGSTGRPVVADLRASDVAAGGHGAPLAALFDRLLLADEPRRTAALNLGGIANVSVVAGGLLEAAFDIGPGNVLIDAAAGLTGGQRYDRAGAGAARGRPHAGLLDRLLADPFYRRQAPKSTGRERFNSAYLRRHLIEAGLWARDTADLPGPDLLATVTELTARTIGDALDPFGVAVIALSGGGTNNPTLLGRLAAHLPNTRLEPIDRWGIPADSKEAYLFAVLGFLAVCGLPGAEPAATGANHPAVLGALIPPHARFRGLPSADGPLLRLRVVGHRP